MNLLEELRENALFEEQATELLEGIDALLEADLIIEAVSQVTAQARHALMNDRLDSEFIKNVSTVRGAVKVIKQPTLLQKVDGSFEPEKLATYLSKVGTPYDKINPNQPEGLTSALQRIGDVRRGQEVSQVKSRIQNLFIKATRLELGLDAVIHYILKRRWPTQQGDEEVNRNQTDIEAEAQQFDRIIQMYELVMMLKDSEHETDYNTARDKFARLLGHLQKQLFKVENSREETKKHIGQDQSYDAMAKIHAAKQRAAANQRAQTEQQPEQRSMWSRLKGAITKGQPSA